MSGVESITGLLFTGLKVLLAAAAVYFVLCGAVAALTLHALYWRGLERIELDRIGLGGAEWIGLMFIQLRAEAFVSVSWN